MVKLSADVNYRFKCVHIFPFKLNQMETVLGNDFLSIFSFITSISDKLISQIKINNLTFTWFAWQIAPANISIIIKIQSSLSLIPHLLVGFFLLPAPNMNKKNMTF